LLDRLRPSPDEPTPGVANERQLLGVDTRKRNATKSAAVLEALTPFL
jgi:hypothetical protein